MSSKSKSQLRTENSTNFPNNNSQFITPEKLRGFNNDIIDSLVVSSDTGSYVTTSSFDNGTRIQTFTKADGTTYTNSIPDATVSTGSLLTTSSFDDGTRLMTFTKGDGSTYTNSIPGGDETGSLLTTASVVDATTTYTKGDGSTFTTIINNVVNATSASHAEQADNATSSSNSISSSVVSDPNIAYINKNNTFSGTQNFLNISVSGTGSFGRINSVTGSAKIIGDAFVVVNADTPTLRYAGLQVYDSGSSSTASIEWDGGNDSWILVEEGGQSSFILTGPTGSKGSEVDLTNNTIPKAGVHRQLIDSIITDNGSTVSIGGNLIVSGNVDITGTYSGDGSSLSGVATLGGNTFTGNQIVQSTFPVFQSKGDSSGGQIYAGFQMTDDSSTANSSMAVSSFTGLDGSNPALEIKGPDDTRLLWSSTNFPYLNAPQKIVAEQGLDIQGIVSSSNYISASAFIGDGSQLTGVAGGIFVETGSFYSTTNDLQVTGSFGVSKAIGGKNSDLTIASNTASIDLTQSNTYTVTLVSSVDTHLDVSTFGETAQSVNVLVKQPAAGNTGSISFSPDFKFGQGYSYNPTPANSSEDILSFTRFGNSLYGTYINNFN